MVHSEFGKNADYCVRIQNIKKAKRRVQAEELNTLLLAYYLYSESLGLCGQPVSMSWCRAHSGTCDQISLPVGTLLSENCCIVSAGRPLRREDGSADCSAITQWPESLRTRNHTLLSHLRLPQSGGPGSRIYIPQEQDGSDILPGTGFLYVTFLRLAGLRWRYSNPPPHGKEFMDFVQHPEA
jgi:hypothetical protein